MTWLTGMTSYSEPEVLAYSEKETYTEEKWDASAQLLVPWDDRHGVFDNILSNFLEWPYRAGSLMWATSGSIEPYAGKVLIEGGGVVLNTYPKAKLTVNFTRGGDTGSPGGEEEDVALYFETVEANGEMIKINPKDAQDQQRFYWDSTPTVEQEVTPEEAPSRLIIGFDYVLRWVGLTTIPIAILGITDHVNDDDVASPSLGVTFPEETLLANAPRISRTVTTGDADKFEMEIRFSYREHGWNQFWNPKTQLYSPQWYIPDGGPAVEYKNYPTYDMSGVLP